MRSPNFPKTGNNRLDEFLQFAFFYFLRGPSFLDVSIDSNYNVKQDDCFLFVDTSVARTITLLPLEQASDSQVIFIKDSTGNAGANNITINGTIDGAVSKTISSNWGKLILKKTPTQYLIIGD